MEKFSHRRTWRRLPRDLLVSFALAACVFAAGDTSLASGAIIMSGDKAHAAAIEANFSKAEVALYEEFHGRTPITTRRKAERILAAEADSIIAHFVLGAILREAEGALGESMRHLGRARELYEGRWPADALHPEAPWQLHRELLFELQQLAGELEKHEYRLSLLDYYNTLYEPDLLGERAWPLLSLDRPDAAREAAARAKERGGVVQRSLGRNAACAIEGLHGTQDAWFRACLEAFVEAERVARDDPPFASPEEASSVAVHAYNAALAARAMLRPDEVERIARLGTRRLEYTAANPWGVLVRLFLDQGRGREAAKALLEAERWRARQPPALRDQIRGDADALAATLLLLAGKADAGRGRIDRALLHPDRRGLTSVSREQTAGAHALLRRSLRRAQGQRKAERQACGDPRDQGWWQRFADGVQASFDDAADLGRIERALEGEEAAQRSFGYFLHGGLEPLPVWLLGDLIEIMGVGVARVALEGAQRGETAEGMQPYFDAIEFEIQYRSGNWKTAWSYGELVLDRLPPSEVALRARVAALAADAARRDGEASKALALLEFAMAEEPGVLRRMAIELPVQLSVSAKGAGAERLGKLLLDSPRFVAAEGGFGLDIVDFSDGLQVCLDGPSGSRLGCHGLPPAQEGDSEALAARDPSEALCHAVHDGAFALPLGLTGTDMGSLDGTSIISDESSRRRLQRTLDTFVRD
jgi:hypothetical protein